MSHFIVESVSFGDGGWIGSSDLCTEEELFKLVGESLVLGTKARKINSVKRIDVLEEVGLQGLVSTYKLQMKEKDKERLRQEIVNQEADLALMKNRLGAM